MILRSCRHNITLPSLLFLMLLGLSLTPFIQTNPVPWISDSPSDPKLTHAGEWGSRADPYPLNVDTYYTLPNSHDRCYTTFYATVANQYYVYLNSLTFWNAELFNDSAYSVPLGTFYSVPSHSEYMVFSPDHSGWYYLILSSYGFDGKLSILKATDYQVNSTRIVVIGPDSCPVKFLGVDLIQGNYTTSQETLYVKIARGWNYVILDEQYGELGPASIYLENGSYGIIIEKSCNFCLKGYLSFPKNETIPPEDNKTDTDTGQTDSIFGGLNLTPLFGIGILVGLCVLYKFRKKK